MTGKRPRRCERLGAEWETHRPAVFGAAYRLLGSAADAEDVALIALWSEVEGTPPRRASTRS
ncbi:sigma factor [Pseudonocardia alaniniphila]|uniref:Sigma-70-like protein n=1 Tax=Pseudonocardia alaniniphila TaxID=75291 RepID=A0ABS9TNZ4_9PSEU|nr:sigma factor [Pseudonocardia alaniniphila]MCH6170268.1 hypothetical protein [Pseudonocardia alaniniphila]